MEKKYTRNRKDKTNVRCISCQLDFDIPTIKIENLKFHKSSLEELLLKIKENQIAILSISEKSINKCIIKGLKELKDNLVYMLGEKIHQKEFFENENNQKKIDLQGKLFYKKENEQVKLNNINNKSLTINNLKSEIFLLKNLNFMAQNYIDQINSIYLKKSSDYNYIKLCLEYTFIEEKEIECVGNKYYTFITKLLHQKICDVRKQFKSIVSAKQTQNEDIETTSQNLNQLKIFIEKRKNGYMDNKEIIQEESKEFTQSITFTKMNYINNNLMNIYNKNKQTENEYGDNIIIIDYPDDDGDDDKSFNSDNFSDSGKKERRKNKDITINNNIQQQLINLNMNINFNVNFDKFCPNLENIMHNTERNNNDILQFFTRNKRKKGLSSTGSLPFLSNSIKDESSDISISENKNKINDSMSTCKCNNSKEKLTD